MNAKVRFDSLLENAGADERLLIAELAQEELIAAGYFSPACPTLSEQCESALEGEALQSD